MQNEITVKKDDKVIRSMVSGCLSKVAYLTMWKAHQAAKRVVDKGGPQLYSYSCPHCGCVHLTKRKYGSSHFEYRPYKRFRTMWEKEREFSFENVA